MTSHTQSISTGTDDLLATLDAGVLTLTLNRPEARNAFTQDMIAALVAQLDAAQSDSNVRCIVVTGSGGAFCAGGDVKGMASRSESGQPDGVSAPPSVDEQVHHQRLQQRGTTGRLFSMPKPTLAALPGPAAGAGMSIALSCDLRIMASTAFMTTAFAKIGLSGDYGGIFFLTQLVGPAKARELYFLADRIGAEEALRLGITNWVCEPEDLAKETQVIAARLASGPPIAYRYMKENLNRAVGSSDVGACMDLEATFLTRCFETEDHRNAALAFAERRAPVFEGR